MAEIGIWCDRGHDPTYIGALASDTDGVWSASGPHVDMDVRNAAAAKDQPDPQMLKFAGPLVRRYVFRCPECRLDVPAADRLGTAWQTEIRIPYPGHRHDRARTVAQWGVGEVVVVPGTAETEGGRKTREALATFTSTGVSRLSLSGLGRILSM